MMDSLRNLFGRGEDRALERETWPLQVFAGGPTLVGPTIASGPIGEREALGIVDCWACVSVIVGTCSTVPLIAYRRAGEGRQRLTSGKLPDLLTRPAPAVTQGALIGQLVTSLATRGNAYLGLFTDGTGAVGQLGVIPPERIITQIVGGAPLYWYTHPAGRQTKHDDSEIVHMRLPVTLDGVTGLSPLAQNREALGLSRALAEQAASAAVNDSAPRGILRVENSPNEDEVMQNLRANWETRHAGVRNAGRVAVLTSDVSFTAVGFTPRDNQFVDQRKLSTVDVCRIFGVPPWLINAPSNDSMTYANTETQAAAFVKFCLSTYLTAIEQAISNSPLCSANSYVEFLYDALLRPDSLVRSQVYTAALGNPTTGAPGWMTRAEVRAREGLPEESPESPAQPVQLEAVA